MDKKDIIEFFDRRAHSWDAVNDKNDAIIEKILDNAGLCSGMTVLDVACGTGVMFEHYLSRGVSSVTAVDIAPNMAAIAAEKYAHEPRVQVICGDIEELSFQRCFDRIVVYNAFPHFPHPQKLIKRLAALLSDKGRLCIAHGASRETIDRHHEGHASKVSLGLMEAEELKALLSPYLDVDVCISDDVMYQLCGTKR